MVDLGGEEAELDFVPLKRSVGACGGLELDSSKADFLPPETMTIFWTISLHSLPATLFKFFFFHNY